MTQLLNTCFDVLIVRLFLMHICNKVTRFNITLLFGGLIKAEIYIFMSYAIAVLILISVMQGIHEML